MLSKKWLLLFVITFISLFFFNFIAHGLILSNLNSSDLDGIRRTPDQLNMMTIALNYLVQSAALLFFLPLLTKGADRNRTALVGFVLGAFIFLVGGLNNAFLLPRWPVFVIVSDTIANGLVYLVMALELRYLLKRFV